MGNEATEEPKVMAGPYDDLDETLDNVNIVSEKNRAGGPGWLTIQSH